MPPLTKLSPSWLGLGKWCASILNTCAWPDETGIVQRCSRSVCLLFGTGPKGVPKEARDLASNHMDITFGGHSLETCTALGAPHAPGSRHSTSSGSLIRCVRPPSSRWRSPRPE